MNEVKRKNHVVEPILEGALPDYSGRMNLVSTPGSRQNYFYEAFQAQTLTTYDDFRKYLFEKGFKKFDIDVVFIGSIVIKIHYFWFNLSKLQKDIDELKPMGTQVICKKMTIWSMILTWLRPLRYQYRKWQRRTKQKRKQFSKFDIMSED